MWHQFFQKTYCLNQTSRPDRRAIAEEEFAKHVMKVEFFPAIEHPSAIYSFCASQTAILQKALDEGLQNWLVVEDDVLFAKTDHVFKACMELPASWDLLYLGANIFGNGFIHHLDGYSKHLCVIRRAWTTHAIAWTRKGAEFFLERYDPKTGAMFDDFLSNILHFMQAFIIRPMAAWQKPGKSDLWGNETDYTGCFKAGDVILNAIP